jgi:hypothetical protein
VLESSGRDFTLEHGVKPAIEIQKEARQMKYLELPRKRGGLLYIDLE